MNKHPLKQNKTITNTNDAQQAMVQLVQCAYTPLLLITRANQNQKKFRGDICSYVNNSNSTFQLITVILHFSIYEKTFKTATCNYMKQNACMQTIMYFCHITFSRYAQTHS